ncbi:MAG: orotidine 5'-phosphate decarboxylase [Proteobacteria bacterium]|nr:orotidine 5'-phosphate decarboxylase [Pseudomonadota bacterium]
MARFRSTHGILPALDMDSLDDMRRIVELTGRVDGVVGFKVGLTATLRLGLEGAVKLLRPLTDLPLIYDHQKAGPDVPDMAAKFAATCRAAGVDGVILFPVAGPRAVREFVGNALKNQLVPLVGGDLPLPDYNVSGGGFIADDALDRIFALAIEIGAQHFIVPANKPEKVKHHADALKRKLERPSLFMPGIGALGGSISATFSQGAGCNLYAVIGRAIYGAPDPLEAAKQLAGEALRFA